LTESRIAGRGRSRVRTRIIIAIGVIVAIVVLAIVIDSAAYHNKVHAGVSIAGRAMGGLTEEAAASRVKALAENAQKRNITLTNEDKTWELKAEDLGTTVDTTGTVSAAMAASREGNILTKLGKRFKLYFSGIDIPLRAAVDDTKLDAALAKIAGQIDVPPVNAGLAFKDGEIKLVEGQAGRVVDIDRLRTEVKRLATALRAASLPIPIKTEEPVVGAEDTNQAVAQAKVMISAPVVLTSGDQKWTVTPEQIKSYMSFTIKDDNGVATLVPLLERAKMEPLLNSIAKEVAVKAVDAFFKTDGEKASVVPAVVGKKLDAAKTAAALLEAARKTGERTAAVTITTIEPGRTTAEAEALGIKEKLGSYTTQYTGTSNRQTNVRITTKYASDVILAPGEIYDFDRRIGPRTAARGYTTAPGIVGGGKLEDVFGGGICQVSTTLFNAAFFAGLEIVERKNHSLYISHYPKGRDATVSAGGPNMCFKNDMRHSILVRGTSDGITTTFVIYGTDEGRKVTYTTSDFYNVVARTTVTVRNPRLPAGQKVVTTGGQTGRQLKVVRTVKLPDGAVVHTDTFVSTYPMIPQKIEVGTASTTTVSTTSTSTTSTSTASTTAKATVTTTKSTTSTTAAHTSTSTTR
jgi:vancomycin resistance protein YoaR